MRNRAVGAVLKSVRTLFEVGTSAGLSDSQLLERYLLRRDDAAEAAFRALVERHGSMVFRACRGVLRDDHASEDAFQATFLILARKAGRIRKRDSVASWLFGVARRVAARAEARRKRSAAHERQGAAMREAKARSSDQPPDPIPELQEEVDQLPERYRALIVLCYFEGLTREEAASRLRLPASTVRVRLMRARSRLRDRLIRRGLAPTVIAGISASRAEAAIPPLLVDETLKAAIRIAVGRAAGVSAPVAALVEGMIRAMLFANLKTATSVLAALMLASVLMISLLAGPAPSEQDPDVAKDLAAAPAAADSAEIKGDGPEVPVVTVKRSRWERRTSQPGTVKAAQSVDIYARISGYLGRLPVDIGSRVKRGDLLAEVDDPEVAAAVEKASAEVDRARARVRKAEAAIQVAQTAVGVEHAKVQAATAAVNESEAKTQARKKQLDRMLDLAKQRSVEQRLADEAADQYASTVAGSNTARSQLLIAKAAVAESRAKIEAAKADVVEAMSDLRVARSGMRSAEIVAAYTKIYCPFDGIVTWRDYHVGDLVRSPIAGNVKPILTIVQTNLMRVVVLVPDRDVPYLDEGDPVTVQIDALGARGVYQGRIARTAYALNPEDRTLRAEIDLPNADGRLRPGQFGRVKIKLETRENVLTIPSSAIIERNAHDTASCYRVAGGRAVRAAIKLGYDDGQRVEVLEGLKDGDIVIANPDARMSDGHGVTIRREGQDPAPR